MISHRYLKQTESSGERIKATKEDLVATGMATNDFIFDSQTSKERLLKRIPTQKLVIKASPKAPTLSNSDSKPTAIRQISHRKMNRVKI